MTASLKLNQKVTSHPLVKEATKSLDESSKPKEIFTKKEILPGEESKFRHVFTSQRQVLKPGQGRAAALEGLGLGDGTSHGPAPSHLLPQSPTRFQYLSMLMEQKRTSKQNSLKGNRAHPSCALAFSHGTSHGNWTESCFSTQTLL